MRIHHTVSFIVDKEKDKPDGKLRMRVRWGEDIRVAVNLGYRVTLDKWDMAGQKCKANTSHGTKRIAASVINHDIQVYREAAELAFERFEGERRSPTADEYRNALKQALSGQGEEELTTSLKVRDLTKEYLRIRPLENAWSEGTTSTVRCVFRQINEEFPALTIREMSTEKWLSLRVEDMVRQGLKNTSIRTWLIHIHEFIYWCAKKGLCDDKEAREYQPKLKVISHTIVWLTWDELMKVYKFQPDTKTARGRQLALARDMFCLSAFTSLRMSDIEDMLWTSVGPDTINVTLEKTDKPIEIELNRYSRAILTRYRQKPDNIHPEFVFPRKYNNRPTLSRRIKDICKACGIDEPIHETYYVGTERKESIAPKWERVSLHTARKTFICNALEMGIAPHVVMSWTGHADYETMKPYIAISQKTKVAEMKKFDK